MTRHDEVQAAADHLSRPRARAWLYATARAITAAKNKASVDAIVAAEEELTRTAGTAEHAQACRKYQRAAKVFGVQHAARLGLLKFGDPRKFICRELDE